MPRTDIPAAVPGAAAPVLVVDLDGTLCTADTLRLFILTAGAMLMRRSPLRAMGMAALVTLRKMRLLSHAAMKLRVMRLSATLPPRELAAAVTRRVMLCLNGEVAALMAGAAKEGAAVVLATAAPELYAAEVGRLCRCAHVMATPLPERGQPLREMRGEAKARAVEQLLSRLQAPLLRVITDSEDDLPLLRLPSLEPPLLVNPTPHLRNLLPDAIPQYHK